MIQWEYRIEHRNINGTNLIVEYLNSMGADGWENYQERDRFYWFKRPIPQPSTAEKAKAAPENIDYRGTPFSFE